MDFETVQSFASSWGLLLFIAAFALVLIYALAPGNREKFRRAAQAPLHDDDETNPETSDPARREEQR